MDACSESVELDHILSDLLIVTHAEVFEVGFSFAYGVVWSEVVL